MNPILPFFLLLSDLAPSEKLMADPNSMRLINWIMVIVIGLCVTVIIFLFKHTISLDKERKANHKAEEEKNQGILIKLNETLEKLEKHITNKDTFNALESKSQWNRMRVTDGQLQSLEKWLEINHKYIAPVWPKENGV